MYNENKLYVMTLNLYFLTHISTHGKLEKQFDIILLIGQENISYFHLLDYDSTVSHLKGKTIKCFFKHTDG